MNRENNYAVEQRTQIIRRNKEDKKKSKRIEEINRDEREKKKEDDEQERKNKNRGRTRENKNKRRIQRRKNKTKKKKRKMKQRNTQEEEEEMLCNLEECRRAGKIHLSWGDEVFR